MSTKLVYLRMDGRRVYVTEHALRVLALSLLHGQKGAAYELGITTQTIKNLLTRLYTQLGVSGAWEGACALGWVRIPADLIDPAAGGSGGRDGRVARQAGPPVRILEVG